MWKQRQSGSLPNVICLTRLFCLSTPSMLSWDTNICSRVSRLTVPSPWRGRDKVMLLNVE